MSDILETPEFWDSLYRLLKSLELFVQNNVMTLDEYRAEQKALKKQLDTLWTEEWRTKHVAHFQNATVESFDPDGLPF